MKRLALIAVLAIAVAFPTAALAEQPEDPSCFGAGASQLAQSSTARWAPIRPASASRDSASATSPSS